MQINEIVRIEDRPDGKKTHFKLHLINGKDMHLKLDKVTDKNQWLTSIRGIKDIYDKKKIATLDRERKYKDTIDVNQMNKIMSEIERNIMVSS